MNRILTRSLLIFMAFVISACGWHLRGSTPTHNIKNIHVGTLNPKSDFSRQLFAALRRQGVQVEPGVTDSDLSLIILKQTSDRRLAAVSSDARASQYMLIEQAVFTILNKNGDELIPKSTLAAERVIEFDEDQVIGMEAEFNIVRKELRDELIRKILTRLGHVANNTSSTKN